MKNDFMIPDHPITIGKVSGVYGVLGWIKIISFTDKADNIFDYTPWFIYLKFMWKLIYLDQWKCLSKRYIAKIRNISNRESAELLVHCSIIIDEKRLPYAGHDEYYCKDLIGCIVVTNKSICLGSVFRIIETTANDVLVIKLYKKNDVLKKKECLIPFIQNKVIKNINLNDRIIIVDWDISL